MLQGQLSSQCLLPQLSYLLQAPDPRLQWQTGVPGPAVWYVYVLWGGLSTCLMCPCALSKAAGTVLTADGAISIRVLSHALACCQTRAETPTGRHQPTAYKDAAGCIVVQRERGHAATQMMGLEEAPTS